jgi:hypothetical protein
MLLYTVCISDMTDRAVIYSVWDYRNLISVRSD